ncbi:MAG: ABC transporter ATP-binding protein [Coriobacteriales bacterium]|jgi:ABC-2 type transport system ATP-binding protein|nr:ABC transporter ATP-binding protein [Coriobacteriales bacterium]
MTVLKVSDVKKTYDKKEVLHGVNFSVQEKEVYGLLGPNGAGKSTLLNIIVNLITEHSGDVEIFAKKISRSSLSEIGFVPQDLAIYEDLSTIQNVSFFGSLYGLKGKVLHENCEAALRMVGLWDQRKRKPSAFSGGMKRRLNIACSIVHSPKLIILDEPTVGIDPQSRNYILESIKALNQAGATIIYTSHYMEEVEAICSKVAIIDDGKIVENGLISVIKEKYQKNNCYECILETQAKIEGVFPKELIADISSSDNKYLITFKTDYINIKDVMALVTDKNSIVSIGKYRPNLEDIFLDITGKALRDGDS